MSNDQSENELTRRDFLRRAAAGAAASLGALSALRLRPPRAFAASGAKEAGVRHRVLGRTELRVSELGLGTIQLNNPAVARRALDLGINYFDTAECYQGGNSETKLGKALKDRREEAVVATKWHTDGRTPARELIASLDRSLGRLGMDHVDLVQIHGAGSLAEVNSDELWDAFTRCKEAGKVRFNGMSLHEDQVALIGAAAESGRYDAVLVSYNALLGDAVGPALRGAHEAGLGTIIMKALQPAHQGKGSEAFAGLAGNPYQQCIRWVLRDPNVSTVVVDMPTFEELEEDCSAVVSPMTTAEREEFERAVAQISPGACHLCGSCTRQCRRGVRVADIMRYELYHDGYGDRARAAELYRALPAGASAAACLDCTECRVVCPWGVGLRSRLERAHVRLA